MDKVSKGFWAGLVTSIPINVLNLIAYYSDFTTMLFLNWAGIFLFGRLTRSVGEQIVGQLGQIMFCGFVGIGFNYFVSYKSRMNYIFKGWLFSVAIWGSIFGISVAFRFPYLSRLPFKTVLTNLILTSIFGMILPEILRWFTCNQKQKNRHHVFRVLPFSAKKIQKEEKKVGLKKPIKLK